MFGALFAEFDKGAVPRAADNHGVELGDDRVGHGLEDLRRTR